MEAQDIINQAKALRKRIQNYGRDIEDTPRGSGAQAQVCEFLRVRSR